MDVPKKIESPEMYYYQNHFNNDEDLLKLVLFHIFPKIYFANMRNPIL